MQLKRNQEKRFAFSRDIEKISCCLGWIKTIMACCFSFFKFCYLHQLYQQKVILETNLGIWEKDNHLLKPFPVSYPFRNILFGPF